MLLAVIIRRQIKAFEIQNEQAKLTLDFWVEWVPITIHNFRAQRLFGWLYVAIMAGWSI